MKMYQIDERMVEKAYKKVKENKGAAGVDGVSIEDFEKDLKGNLYKIWNRMSSGSYFPSKVRMVEIPKSDGKTRILGIPTVADRVAQMVGRLYLEPAVEPHFHVDSYGYRPNKSAHNALSVARNRCFEYAWVIDLDIKGFFDNIDHEMMMLAVRKHTDCKWLILYIERWLTVEMDKGNNQIQEREKGTPQGGVISPLLANLFLHYAFDEWMKRNYQQKPFERYADDIIIHCRTYEEAKKLLEAIKQRLQACKLELHPDKTKIVYCKDDNRKQEYSETSFVFLGYEFRPRMVKSKSGKCFIGFTPGISSKAVRTIREKIQNWRLLSQCSGELEEIAERVNPIISGWINYYGKFNRSLLYPIFETLNAKLVKWVKRKYKKFKSRDSKAMRWLQKKISKEPAMFAHWEAGMIGISGQ